MITETTTTAVLPSGGGKIKRSSFKSRGGAGGHVDSTGSIRGCKAIRVSAPSTVIAELASKFNAVMVDADQGDSMQDIIKKVNKKLQAEGTTSKAKGTVVKATVEKFERTSQKKRSINKMVVVRTNSNRRKIMVQPVVVEPPMVVEQPAVVEHPATLEHPSEQLKVMDHTAATVQPTHSENHTATEQRKIVDQRKSRETVMSAVKKLTGQLENGVKPSKPIVLGPKPITNVTLSSHRRTERRLPLLKDTATVVDRRLLNKDKRLSIARDPDARLESVLNVMPPPKNPQQPTDTERSPLPGYLKQQPQTEPERTPRGDLKQPTESITDRLPPPPLPLKPNCSFLHGWKRPTSAASSSVGETRSTPLSSSSVDAKPISSVGDARSTPLSLSGVDAKPTSSVDDARSTAMSSSDVDVKPTSALAILAKAALAASASAADTTAEEETDPHDYNQIIVDGELPQAIYEELKDIVQPTSTDAATRTAEALHSAPSPEVVLESPYYDGCSSDDSFDENHYTTIEGAEQNIYDVVMPAAHEHRKRQAYEDTSYETVQAPLPPLPPLPPVITVTVVDVSPLRQLPVDRDDNGHQDKKEMFDNSVEIDNSIYGINPPSESTSSGVTSDSVSFDTNSRFDADEDWVDEDSSSEEFFIIPLPSNRFHQKSKINNTIRTNSRRVHDHFNKAHPKRSAEPPSVMPSSYYCNSQTPPPLPPARTQRRRKSLFIDKVSISSQSVISFIKDVPEPLNYKKSPCDFLSEQLLNVVLKTVFLEEKFESQELSLFVDNEIRNPLNQEIPEDIYVTYGSFTSDDEFNDQENVDQVPTYPCENRVLPAPPSQQNVYRLDQIIKKAKKKFKKGWLLGSGSLTSLRRNQIGKITKINLMTEFGNKTYDSTSEKSTDNNVNSIEKKNSPSSTVFYIPPIYKNIENNQIRPTKNGSKPLSIDSRRQSVARPSSPPPPPPGKRHSTGKGSPGQDKSSTESTSENGSKHGSDLYMRFADEPFYQHQYAADISEQRKSVFAGDTMDEYNCYEEIESITSRPSALELITPCTSGHGQHRSLWCEVPEVKFSGVIDSLTPRERKLQEAKFELITSEASYFKSLTLLEKHFINSYSMNDGTILSKKDQKILFGNVKPVRKCSEELLTALEKCWQDNILLKGLSEILYTHSKENFEIFVKYCSNQIYIDRTLKSLKENPKFEEALRILESDPMCQSLTLHSFLMLPMQRITRLPLLVHAILSQMDPTENSLEYQMCKLTLASLNDIVQNCNESTRDLERYEEMLLLSQKLEFSNKKEMKAIASSSRWLVRSGSMVHLFSPDSKFTVSLKSIRSTTLYFFLFNDMFIIAKRKSDENYTVIDYCARNFVQMADASELPIASSYKNLLMLTIFENQDSKTVDMLLNCDSDSSKKRWIEAMSPPISTNPDETLYNEWDCPQVFCEHQYIATQSDELSLEIGDIVKVLMKMNDGWYSGVRIRDGEEGWFPGNYTSEIASQHARAKNLKQRYRLLAFSGSYLQSRQDKIKKK